MHERATSGEDFEEDEGKEEEKKKSRRGRKQLDFHRKMRLDRL